MLSDHEHIIDCIEWAPPDSAKTIENSNYNNGMVAVGDDQNNEEGADGDGAVDGEVDYSGGASAAGAELADDTRATINTRMTTKERI